MMWGNGMGWGAGLLMAMTALGFWALVIVGIVALFHGTSTAGPRERGHQHGARQILDERFARGEIDVDEYRSRQSQLPPTR